MGITDGYGKALKKGFFKDSYSFSDSMLEMVSFDNILGVTLGRGKRVAQEETPIQFRFKDTNRDMYINIDGEFYLLKRPVAVTITNASFLKGGKIRVLLGGN